MKAKGIDPIATIITVLLKFINTSNANKHKVDAYTKPNFIEILPEAIGRLFVLSTFLSNSLSEMSFNYTASRTHQN